MTARPAPTRRAGVMAVLGATAVVAAFIPTSTAAQVPTPVLSASPATLPADAVTDITVTGTSYLRPPLAPGQVAFGGVYVFFGWVSDPSHFGPSVRNSDSNDGTFGVTYAYPGSGGDASTRDDGTGGIRLVSFTPGGESGAATDYHMDDAGNWTTTLRVYGSTFTSTVPTTGETLTFDCTVVQCGVLTIGAHGIASSTNERFFPLTFTASAIAPPATSAPALSVVPTTVPDTTTSTTIASTGPATSPTEPPADVLLIGSDDHDDTPGGDIDNAAAGHLDASVTTSSTEGSWWPLVIAAATVAAVGGGALTVWALRRRSHAPGGTAP